MARASIVWTCCALFALLNIVGAHGHRLPAGHATGAHHVVAHEHSSSLDAPLVLAGTASHEHEHTEHGDIDVDPAKAFSKSAFSNVVPHALAGIGILVPIAQPASPHWRLTPPDRPSGHRSHPYYLPPSHAPPLTA